MNNIQNYQVNFQAGSKGKAVKTLADKLKDKKEVKTIATNFKNKLQLSKQDAADLLEVNSKTTPKQIRTKIKTIFKNLDELWEEVKNMNCVCKCKGDDNSINEGIISIIE